MGNNQLQLMRSYYVVSRAMYASSTSLTRRSRTAVIARDYIVITQRQSDLLTIQLLDMC